MSSKRIFWWAYSTVLILGSLAIVIRRTVLDQIPGQVPGWFVWSTLAFNAWLMTYICIHLMRGSFAAYRAGD